MTTSIAELVEHLRALGVREGDLLMVHASLRAIGPVECGADGVLDAIATTLGPTGTVMMTMGANDDEPFDPLTSRAQDDIGTLAEVFRTRPGTVVSNHPEGRFGASGPLAHELMAAVPLQDYYGPRSPLERFLQRGGRVLRLGAHPDTLTILHYAEYLVPLSAKRSVTRIAFIVVEGRLQLRRIDCLDDEHGIVDYPGEDYFAQILRAYLATGRARTGKVGAATSELIEAADVVDFGVAWMAEHFTAAARG